MNMLTIKLLIVKTNQNMIKNQIKIVCTDARSEMRESCYEFQCGNNPDSIEVITYLKLITNGSISNHDLDKIISGLNKLNLFQNENSFSYPADLLFKPGTFV